MLFENSSMSVKMGNIRKMRYFLLNSIMIYGGGKDMPYVLCLVKIYFCQYRSVMQLTD
ncbi:hypothetical protein XENTR_v10009195 [Xenopus tropicalis]|nr:hypothetical protein XENTR_v10009195 [Xenopus tropicalis]